MCVSLLGPAQLLTHNSDGTLPPSFLSTLIFACPLLFVMATADVIILQSWDCSERSVAKLIWKLHSLELAVCVVSDRCQTFKNFTHGTPWVHCPCGQGHCITESSKNCPCQRVRRGHTRDAQGQSWQTHLGADPAYALREKLCLGFPNCRGDIGT